MPAIIAEKNEGSTKFDLVHPVQIRTSNGQRFALTISEALRLLHSLDLVLHGKGSNDQAHTG